MSDGNDSDSSDGFSDRKSQNRKKRIKKKASKSKTPQEKWVLGSENAIELFLDSFWYQLLKKIIKKRSTRLRSIPFSIQIQIQSLPLLAEDSSQFINAIFMASQVVQPYYKYDFYQSLWGLIEYSDIPRSRRNRSILHISMGNIRG